MAEKTYPLNPEFTRLITGETEFRALKVFDKDTEYDDREPMTYDGKPLFGAQIVAIIDGNPEEVRVETTTDLGDLPSLTSLKPEGRTTITAKGSQKNYALDLSVLFAERLVVAGKFEEVSIKPAVPAAQPPKAQ